MSNLKIDFEYGKEYHNIPENRKNITGALQIRRVQIWVRQRFFIGFDVRHRCHSRGVPGEEVDKM
jgi:hypothetical protein